MSEIENRINEVEERFLLIIGRLRMDYETKVNDMSNRLIEIEENLKLLNDLCLEPVIRNTAVKILDDFFPVSLVPPPSTKWYKPSSSKISNKAIYPLHTSMRFQDMEKPLKINNNEINCELVDVDKLIDMNNSKRHLDDMIREINNIKKIKAKFSENLELPLSIIEKSVKTM